MCPIIVDSREKPSRRDNSDHATELRRQSNASVPVITMLQEYGDVTFAGNGPDGGECTVGIERKRLSDLVTSMTDRRLAGKQLHGLVQTYDFRFLLVEGVWRSGVHGEIEELYGKEWRPFFSREPGRPSVSYRQVHSFLDTIRLKAGRDDEGDGRGIILLSSSNLRETAAQLLTLWHWFNDKSWEEHRSHEALYCGDVPKKGHRYNWGREHAHNEDFGPGRVNITGVATDINNPSTLWRMLAQLPGCDSKAKVAAGHWRTVLNMALAGLDPEIRKEVDRWYRENPEAAAKAWEEIDFGILSTGKRRPGFGRIGARAVVRAVFEEGA